MELNLYELLESADASQVPIREEHPLDPDRIRELTLSRLPAAKPKKRTASRFLLAAALAAALGVTALACEAFLKYRDPQGLLEDFFGDAGSQIGQEDPSGELGLLPDRERTALDSEAAAQAAPYIGQVDQSATYGTTTLTVHGHLYDSVTGSGVIYYTLEDPNGLSYSPSYDNQAIGIPTVIRNCASYGYVLTEKSTDTRLEIAEYYTRAVDAEENYLELCLTDFTQYTPAEEKFDRAENSIRLSLTDGGGMAGLTGKGIRLSPIGVVLSIGEMDFLREADRNTLDTLDALTIRFRDGSEYVVEDDKRDNWTYAIESSPLETVSIGFNRLISVDQVESVVINGIPLTGLQPIREEDRLRPKPYVEQTLDTPDDRPGAGISRNGLTLIPGELRYDASTGTGRLTCTVLGKPEITGGRIPGLKSNQLGRWLVGASGEKETEVTWCFLALEQESDYLKLWFDGSKADPRLNTSTENLIALTLKGDEEDGRILADGAVVLSDQGLLIDYDALGVHQGTTPKNLTLQFSDGTETVISNPGKGTLDCLWLNTVELRNSTDRLLRIAFLTPVDSEQIVSVIYDGKLLTE